MAENQTQEREAPKVNWEAMSSMAADFGLETPAKPVDEKVEVKEETKDTNEISFTDDNKEVKTEEVKTETKAEEKTEAKEEIKAEAKEEVKAEENKQEEPVIELKVGDVEGYKPAAEDGTWKAVGELLEVEVAEESPEALKTALEAKYKAQVEEAKKYSLENEYAKLKPETVTALKLIEAGYPEEQAFNPTAEHAKLLSLDDAALVRTNLEGLEGWDEDRVNMEMEDLAANPAKLKHEALKLKEWLTADATRINAERDALVNQYTQNRDKVALQQKEQEIAQVKEAVMSVDSFMGAKITPEAKSAILQKHSRGDYGNVLKDGKSWAEYLLFKEFGHKILEETRKSSYNKGKEEYTKQMLNIPVKQGEVSKVVQEKIAGTNQQNEGLKAILSDFG